MIFYLKAYQLLPLGKVIVYIHAYRIYAIILYVAANKFAIFMHSTTTTTLYHRLTNTKKITKLLKSLSIWL